LRENVFFERRESAVSWVTEILSALFIGVVFYGVYKCSEEKDSKKSSDNEE
jgi:hypothetical protein